MNEHQFIFHPGEWNGLGVLTFAISPEKLRFYTKWIVSEAENGIILCEQRVETEGMDEILVNNFRFILTGSSTFDIELQNNINQRIKGKGSIKEKDIIWHYKRDITLDDSESFEGMEVYTLQENGEYLLLAEYLHEGQVQTTVRGRIWKK